MSLPYAEPLTILEPAELVIPEPPRRGEPGGKPCIICAWTPESEAELLWHDEHWRLFNAGSTGLPGAVWLASIVHVDSFADLPGENQRTFGEVCARVDKALSQLPDVARVHLSRWGDGGAHFHVWFMPRPLGRLDMRGHLLPIWEDVMPRLTGQELHDVGARVAHLMSA